MDPTLRHPYMGIPPRHRSMLFAPPQTPTSVEPKTKEATIRRVISKYLVWALNMYISPDLVSNRDLPRAYIWHIEPHQRYNFFHKEFSEWTSTDIPLFLTSLGTEIRATLAPDLVLPVNPDGEKPTVNKIEQLYELFDKGPEWAIEDTLKYISLTKTNSEIMGELEDTAREHAAATAVKSEMSPQLERYKQMGAEEVLEMQEENRLMRKGILPEKRGGLYMPGRKRRSR